MGLLTSLSDDDRVLVADTSTVINLNATDCAAELLRALPCRVAMVDIAADELKDGGPKGRSDSSRLAALIAANLIEVVQLANEGLVHFESLVSGEARETLDDGEAATIAFAAQANVVALIDERKALRLCASRFPDVRLGCTVDLFAHPAVRRAFGASRLAEAVHRALVHARMRVLPHHLAGVVDLVGHERAAKCLSLPRGVRTRPTAGK